ncbi:MAG: class I SAM-dependent methyltransferase [Anaerolineae bacterium]|nr:class I SAM-dependent methyltransferase [Anaerolineae bacterium]
MSTSEKRIQADVRNFYDQVGWQMESDGFYQNAVYEDLRPVSREYINRCHLRVNRHLAPQGRFLLDAGSGPIQWPEYLTYSEGYKFRVCADLSIEGLKEARKRIGDHGLFVVADVVHLPFSDEAFDGIVSLHTIHHVPSDEKKNAFLSIYRTLKSGKKAVVVNAWRKTDFMNRWMWLIKLSDRVLFFDLEKAVRKILGKPTTGLRSTPEPASRTEVQNIPRGTYTQHDHYEAFVGQYRELFAFEVYPWRSVSVRFLRALIHPFLFGKWILRRIYSLEEKYPDRYGREGQYPMIVISK